MSQRRQCMSPARRRCVVDAIYVAMHHPRDDIGDRADHRTTPHSYQRTVVVVEKRTFEVVVTNELSIRVRARNESVIPLFRLASCRRLASGDDDLGGRDTAADETETRAESVRCSLAGDIKPGYCCL